jgi:hypothetical protein
LFLLAAVLHSAFVWQGTAERGQARTVCAVDEDCLVQQEPVELAAVVVSGRNAERVVAVGDPFAAGETRFSLFQRPPPVTV